MSPSENVPLSPSDPIGVVGAGTMGLGIALVAASAGHSVLLHDADPAAVTRGLDRLRVDLDRQVERGKLSGEEREARLARIVPVSAIEALAPARLVIEAIVENLAIKASVLRGVEVLIAPDAIVATNTSSLSVTALAAQLARPGQVVGMHFFNPAPILPLVEVVSGYQTTPQTAATVFATAARWGKTPVHCRSTPGFIVNRVARPFYGEALRLLQEGAATPATLDAIAREAGGFRMGPFELMDLIGHDINYAVTSSVYEACAQDPRYRPSLLQKELVDAGLLGRKSGRGFYGYGKDAERPAIAEAAPGPRLSSLIVEGDLGPAAILPELATAAGISIEVRNGTGRLRLGDLTLALTDGRTATQRMAESGEPTVLFDLALDYGTASRIAIAGADQAPPDVLARAAGFFQALGKKVSVLDDAPGLMLMRMVAMLANEAADVAHQGVASGADIDLAMQKGANYPRGPLAWADAVGPHRLVRVIDELGRFYGEDRYRTSPRLRRRALARQNLNRS